MALTGAGGAGKTTLLNALEKHIGDRAPVFNVSTQSVMDEYGFKTHQEVVQASVVDSRKAIDFQIAILTKRYNEFREKVKYQSSFMTDRTPLDCFIYYMIHNNFFDLNSAANVAMQKEVIQRSAFFYDKIFLIPTGVFDVKSEAIGRPESNEYAHMYQALLMLYAKQLGYDLIVINSKSVEDRVAEVLDHVKDLI